MPQPRYEEDDEPRNLPSTTRAVAWGALFFAFLAFVISVATLFLTWRDGVLARNTALLTREIGTRVSDWREARVTGEGGEGLINPDRLRDRIGRIETMIRSGDSTAAYHMDALREELETLRRFANPEAAVWFQTAGEDLREAREQLEANATAAAQKLQHLGSSLHSARGMLGALGARQETQASGSAAASSDGTGLPRN